MRLSRSMLVGLLATVAIACGGGADVGRELRLDYGPVLRSVDARSAGFLFRAARQDGGEQAWTASIEIAAGTELSPESRIPVPEARVDATTEFVAHVTVEGLEPQTRYTYVPLINGRRALDGTEPLPSFVTAPELGERNADFTIALLADQHTADGRETPSFEAYAAAAGSDPLFWAQLGDVAASTLTPGTNEEQRSREEIHDLWRRNYGDPSTPQARFAASHSLRLATISDHELMDNYSMNWHRSLDGIDEAATLHDRLERYDRSIGAWWNYFGRGGLQDDRMGRVAREDHGESVMAEPSVVLLEDATENEVCVDDAPGSFARGGFVYLVNDAGDAFATRISEVGDAGSCAAGRGRRLTLAAPVSRPYRRDEGARIANGARYANHGHYLAYRPFPYVEFFLLDTTSYRGDPYQERDAYAREANRDTDHAAYPWNATDGRRYIYGDREHGANRTTDGVRSWLGPEQKAAFLDAIAGSDAELLVVTAGYPLYSAKFEWSRKYWPGRESGHDFASEVEEIVAAFEASEKLVLWVHGDGHTPMLVRLRPNLYQLQVGPTRMGHMDSPGHRSRTLASGDRAVGELLGGGTLIAGHQPDLQFGDESEDFFGEHLDQFEGYLRLYFHPGREALRSSERSGLRRGESNRVVEIPAEQDPARGEAGRRIVGRVVRMEFGGERRHSVVESYRYEKGMVRLELQHPIVTANPDLLRVLLDDDPWVEARWFDAQGREWRDFGHTLRRAK